MAAAASQAVSSPPAASEPAATRPSTTNPSTTEPAATEPVSATQPASTEPAATSPDEAPSGAAATQPKVATGKRAGRRGVHEAESPIRAAIAQLAEEAIESRRSIRLQHSEPDFAKRTSLQIDPADVLEAISRPAHKDAFIDAYVRWQLTSLDPITAPGAPELIGLDDRRFAKLLGNLPPLLENPRADRDLLARLDQLEKRGAAARQLDAWREIVRELDHQTTIQETFNKPATELRDWLAAKFAGRRARLVQMDAERCAATIKAGWPSRSAKTRLTKSCKAAGNDSMLPAADRLAAAGSLRNLIGLRRVSVKTVDFKAEGGVNVSTTTAATDEDDVAKWTESLGIRRK